MKERDSINVLNNSIKKEKFSVDLMGSKSIRDDMNMSR